MFRELARSKIHRVKVTATELYYEGSITVDEEILEAADMVEGEKVDVLNLNNGGRVQTYLIAGKRKSGDIVLNGPAAKSGAVGDEVIIISYYLVPQEKIKKMKTKPRVVYVDEKNHVTRIKK